ncbi:SAM domain-containing protein [Paraburkholderia sediminicola]|uniref:SAM domain-containing protein n=1 Tax=Paraburkholderia rhynchosiae TaxID=487049 RepID=A0ACC7NP56_9BURK
MADDLTRWLVQVGLGGHAATFASQGIDWDVLGELSEQDLKELGLPLGDRKRLLKALAALTDARTPSREPELERQEQPASSAAGALEASFTKPAQARSKRMRVILRSILVTDYSSISATLMRMVRCDVT